MSWIRSYVPELPVPGRRCPNAESIIIHHFPAPVVDAMMHMNPVPSLCKEDISILFASIADYPSIRCCLDPPTIGDLLDRHFRKLDRLAELHGVQRVDTIDGCYIAAANFSAHQPTDHALRLARFALDAMAAAATTAMDEQRPELGPVRLRAGMHCGAVCGSVVGAHGGRKYTLLGDAVNVSSRMESHGAAGAVQCSAASAARIEAQGGGGGGGLALAARDGGVELKGRGHMAAFWLCRTAAAAATEKAAADGGSGPRLHSEAALAAAARADPGEAGNESPPGP